jgi:hypothetical protein
MKIICLIFCLLSFCLCINAKPEPKYYCKETTCYIEHASVRTSDPAKFKTFSEILNVEALTGKNVATELVIKSSTIFFFEVGLCKVFPQLVILRAENNNFVNVDEDAFKDCEHLKEIYLGDNDILEFKTETFTRNKNLQTISLFNNPLPLLDPYQFSGLKMLQHVNLSGNNFHHISPYIFQSTVELKTLDLSHNNLVEFDVNKFLGFCPTFHEIDLSHNVFRCDSLKEIVEKLKEKQVNFVHNEAIVRKRPFDDKVEGYVCLNDQNYIKYLKSTYTVLKKSMEYLITEMTNAKTVFDRYNEILEDHTGKTESLV